MDYIYGKLNFEIKKVEYEGTTTETATTVVTSDEANEISVDVLKVPNTLTAIDNFDESEVVFDGSSNKTITIPSYSMLKTPVSAEENYAEYQLTRNGEPVGDKIIIEIGGGGESLNNLIEDLQDGTMIVKKAEQDQLGNVINNTYETKTDANLVRGRVTLLENANMVKSVNYESLTHKITFTFYDNTTQLLDLPLESTIVGASYDNATKDITFTLQNDSTLIVPLDDLVSGLASETWVDTYFIPKTSIVDNLITDDATKVLSAKQGKVLQDDVIQLESEKQDKLVAGENIIIDENNVISASMGIKFWTGAQAEYDSLSEKDENTLYFIEEE